MGRYSIELRHRVYVQGYGFLSLVRNMGKGIGKNISKNLSGKYSPGMLVACKKFIDRAKQLATDALKIDSKGAIQ